MPVAPVLILFIAIVAANLAVMALILVPPLVGRSSPLASDVAPGVDAERRAAEEAIVGGIDGSVTDDGVSTRTYDRVVRVVSWVFLLTHDRDRRGDRAVARDAAGDPRPAGLLRAVRRDRPRPAPAGHARSGQVRGRGLGGDHRGDPARGADRRRHQPVLLRLPAHRRWGRARGHARRSRSPSPRRRASATSSRSSSVRRRDRSVRRPRPRSAST